MKAIGKRLSFLCIMICVAFSLYGCSRRIVDETSDEVAQNAQAGDTASETGEDSNAQEPEASLSDNADKKQEGASEDGAGSEAANKTGSESEIKSDADAEAKADANANAETDSKSDTEPEEKEKDKDNLAENKTKEAAAEETEEEKIQRLYGEVLLTYQKVQKEKLTEDEIADIGLRTELIQHGWPMACLPDEVKFQFYDIDKNGIGELFIQYYGDIADIYAYDGEKVKYVFGNPYRGIAALYPDGMIAETFSYSASNWYAKWFRYDTGFADFFPEFEMLSDGKKVECYTFSGGDREEIEKAYKESGEYPVWVFEWSDQITEAQYDEMCPKDPEIRLPEGKKIADFNPDTDLKSATSPE